jgi:hypothetical protein
MVTEDCQLQDIISTIATADITALVLEHAKPLDMPAALSAICCATFELYITQVGLTASVNSTVVCH